MAAPKFAVVIPAYNAEAYLAETIRSVLAQTLEDFELVIVNDGSKDNTLAIAQGFTDNRIRVINKPNSGVSDSRNVGVAATTAPFIAFLDADDLFEPGKLQACYEALLANPSVSAVANRMALYYGPNDARNQPAQLYQGSPEPQAIRNYLLELRGTPFVSPSSASVRRAAFAATGGFDTQLSMSADLDMWLRLTEQGPFLVLPQVLGHYRLHAQQMSHKPELLALDNQLVFEKARKAGYFTSKAHYHRCMAGLHRMLAANYRAAGRWAAFFKHLITAAGYSPVVAVRGPKR